MRRRLGGALLSPELEGLLFGEKWQAVKDGYNLRIVNQEAKDGFLKIVDSMIEKLVQKQEKIAAEKKKGAPPLDHTKLNSAEGAYVLLKQFGSRPPTKTVLGPFYELATILYEGATGRAHVSIQWYCRMRLDPRKFPS